MTVLAALALGAAPALAAPAPTPAMTLNARGLAWTGGQVTFGMPRAAAIAAVTKAVGAPVKTSTHPDCGQGAPMAEAVFRGSLSMLFLKGKFSGWTVGMDDGLAHATYRTAKGVGFGTTRKQLKVAYPAAEIDEGSLGIMFTVEGAPSGFLDEAGAKVTALFSGETCMIS